MAADNEHRLISKVIRDREIIPVLQRGVADDWFLDEQNRQVWKFVRSHYANYQEVPTAVTVKDSFPNYRLLNVDDALDYLLDQMVAFRRRKLTKDGLEVALEKFAKENDHDGALLELERTLTQVHAQGIPGTTTLDLTTNPEQRFEEYKSRGSHTLLGVATGYEKIDEATAGLQGGQLVTLIAPPKTGKSQIALRMAIETHERNLVPMFQSFEMNNVEQQQRHDAMRAHVSHNRLRRGTLTPDEETRYTDMLKLMSTKQSFHLVDAIGGLTVSALAAKVEQLKPDVVFVDGVYLMLDEVSGDMNTPQALTNITRALKRLAQKMDLPVVITTQTLLWKMRGNKVSADSIGYSSSFFQDSDVILGLEPVEEDESIRLLKIVASRNCGPQETTLIWNWDTGCFHDEFIQSKCPYCRSSLGVTP